MARRGYSETAALTYLAADVTSGATSFTAQDASTWAGIATSGPFIVTLDRGRVNEERLLCTTINTTTGVISGATRGYHGTTAVAHTAAVCTVEHTSAAIDFDEANGHINDTTLDHHSQYARTDGSRTVTGGQTFSSTVSVAGTATLLSATNKIGRGAAGAANAYTQIGDDANGGLIAAQHGTAADARLTLKALGTGDVRLQTGAGNDGVLLDQYGNVKFGGSVTAPTNQAVVAVSVVGVVPSGTPVNGGWLYVQGGSLIYKGSSGTVTTVAPA